MSILRKGSASRKGQNPNNTSTAFGDEKAFPLAVPDYIRVDWRIARPKPRPTDEAGRLRRGRQRIGEGLHWAIHQAVIVQKCSRVILADVILAQVIWGGVRGNWPQNWRQRLVQRLKRAATLNTGLSEVVHRESDEHEYGCPAACPLHGGRVRHQHLEITIRTPEDDHDARQGDEESGDLNYSGTFLGALEVFGYGDSDDRAYHWNPRPLPADSAEDEEPGEREEHKQLLAKVKALKRAGQLAAVYFPLKLFGSSPCVGLSWSQRQLLQAITRELTRGRGKTKSCRPDRAEIVIGKQSQDAGEATDVAPCPHLEPGVRHVGFNGNGGKRKRHLHGRGYKPFVWMKKAAYESSKDGETLWRKVRAFLRDLDNLARLFGLVVAAWHPKECSWRPLDELQPLTRTSAGRAWLRSCLLRVYTQDNFLLRWRQFFAARMGFTVIPDTRCEQVVERSNPTASREAFLAYLNRKGISPAELARQLGLSRFPVSRHLSGQRGWTAAWRKRIERWFAGQEGGKKKVATRSL